MTGTGDPPTKRDPQDRDQRDAAHAEVRERVRHGAGEAQQAVDEPIENAGSGASTQERDVAREVADAEAARDSEG